VAADLQNFWWLLYHHNAKRDTTHFTLDTIQMNRLGEKKDKKAKQETEFGYFEKLS
jgi:hypothetical protein